MKTLIAVLLSGGLLGAAPSDFERAQKAYNHTDYEQSLKLLLPLTSMGDVQVDELVGQSYFMLGDYKKAVESLTRAVSVQPENSDFNLWLGRAYGKRAETSFALSAVGLASKSRQYLEKAVQLNPHNSEAVDDLFEFYVDAPGFLGGGFDKAGRLADRIAERDPAEGSYARARIAEARKEFNAAEMLLRRAAELAPQQVGRVLDLAKFLAKQGRFEESDRAFGDAEKIAPDAPKVLFAKADTYIKTNRNINEARELLRRYLASNLTPDDPSRSEAVRLLKQVAGT